MRKNIWRKRILLGALLGPVLFVAGLSFAIYSRWMRGMPNSFYLCLIFWRELAVYLLLCVVTGFLIYLIASFVVSSLVSFAHRLRTNPPQ